jgi:hypothetical protein
MVFWIFVTQFMQSKKIFKKKSLLSWLFPILLWHSIRGDFLEIWNSAEQHFEVKIGHVGVTIKHAILDRNLIKFKSFKDNPSILYYNT